MFVGDGVLRGRLEEEAGENVVFAGFRTDARSLLRAFDIVLLCATSREAFGVVLLEAMAGGVPVVLADQPGPRSVVGDCGTYFVTDDELVMALRTLSSQHPTETVERGRQRVSAAVFPWSRWRNVIGGFASIKVMDRLLPSDPEVHVLVVGDVMLDRYLYGRTERVSEEAPVPIVQVDGSEDRLGGRGKRRP